LIVALVGSLLGGCAKRIEVPEPERSEPTGGEAQVVIHRVAAGETLAIIADNYYGDPGRAAAIARANELEDPNRLAVGSTLLLRFTPEEWRDARHRAAALESYNRGVEALDRDDLETAESQFRLALRTAPELVSARYNLALVLDRRGRFEEAATTLAELHAARPHDADIAFALGHAYFQQGAFDAAAEAFERALAERPGHRRAAFGLARSLQESGRGAEAAAAWRHYLELDSTSSWADQARRHLRELESG
jgi:tetratricopeptide (TPR) repeat protein